jgi:Fe-S-cluster containining protein
VEPQEIETMAAAAGLAADEFQQKYVRRVGRRRSLREKPNGECVLYEPGVGCTVYAARPRQCRSWPFWESNLESPQAWQRVCRDCPGAGSGPLFTVDQILAESARIAV